VQRNSLRQNLEEALTNAFKDLSREMRSNILARRRDHGKGHWFTNICNSFLELFGTFYTLEPFKLL